jgi:5-methylcytosine-specific restriction endonuclease McrA
MNERRFWKLQHLADAQLEDGLRELVARGRQTDARVLAHLAEVETRRLHLKSGAESLFAYCQKRLNLSENQAFYRIVAARAARQFPSIFELLAGGDIHLTSLALLSKYLTEENHRDLLSRARGKTKRELLELLAQLAPRPDVRSTIRRLPARVIGSDSSLPTPHGGRYATAPSSISNVRPAGSPRAVAAGPTACLEPLSPTAYRLQLNTTPQLKAKLELARDLMSHSNPSGDLAVVVERALDLLLSKLNNQRFGQLASASRANGEAGARKRETPAASQANGETDARRLETPARASQQKRRHIQNAIRRQLVARDGLCCTFISETGQRCTTRAFLQIHHDHAWSKGGSDTLDNLRLLCGSHNGLLAAQEFGERRAS